MSDVKQLLEEAAGSYRPTKDEEAVRRRVRRHERTRRAAAGSVAFAVFVAAGWFAWSTFRPIEDTIVGTEFPDVARIACTDEGTEVAASDVRVQSDGIHFAVDNRSSADEVLIVGTGEVGSLFADIDLSKATRHVFDRLPPGNYLVGCFVDELLEGPFEQDELRKLDGLVPLRFVDVEQLYASPKPDCPEGQPSERPIPDPDRRTWDSIAEMVRELVPGVRSADVVEPSGYPASRSSELEPRIVREGRVVALVRVAPPPLSLIVSVTACEGTGIGGASPRPELGPATPDGYSVPL